MANIRPPEFNVKKDELTLTTQDPASVLYGVTPDDQFIPIRIDNEGRLEIGSVALDVSDLQIGAVEIKDHNSNDRVAVNTNNELLVESRLHDGLGTDITSTLISGKQGIDVHVIGGSSISISTDEDGDVPANQTVANLIAFQYGYNGTSWGRINQTSGELHSRLFAAGTEISATGNSLDVNVTGGAVGGPSDTEDGSVAGGQNANLSIGLNYGWNGVDWERINSSSNRLIVDGSGVTQPISASSLPLPTGAATEATLSSIDTTLDISLSTRASELTLETFRTDFNAVDFATEATLATLLTTSDFQARINTLGQKTSIASTPVVLASDQSSIPVTDNGGSLTVDGTVSVDNFPSSFAVDLRDGSGNVIGSTAGALDVNIASGVTLEVNLDNANDDVLVYGNDSTTNRALRTDADGHLQIDVLSSDLPTGAATEATLSSIDGKITTADTDDVRQATHDNLNANTNIQVGDTDVSNGNPVPISDAGSSITVDGTVTANAGTGTFTTDPIDRQAREIGRVTASHTIHAEEIYNTVDAFANARPTEGDFIVQHHKTKSIVVKNTGVNNADVQIFGSVDGTNLDIVIVPSFNLTAGSTSVTSEERAFTHIRIEAKSRLAGNPTTIVTKAYSLGN